MIEANTISFNYIKKEPLSGSYRGMRYRMTKEEEGLLAVIWPEPYNFLHTPEDKKQKKVFSMTAEGKEEAVAWLNEQYEQQKALWDLALHTPL